MILPLKTKNTFSTNRLLKSTLNVQASSHSLAVSRSPAAGEIRRRGDSSRIVLIASKLRQLNSNPERHFKRVDFDTFKILLIRPVLPHNPKHNIIFLRQAASVFSI